MHHLSTQQAILFRLVLHYPAAANELSSMDGHYDSAQSDVLWTLVFGSEQLPWERHRARGAVCGKLSGPSFKSERDKSPRGYECYCVPVDACLTPPVRDIHLKLGPVLLFFILFALRCFLSCLVWKLPQEKLELSRVEETPVPFTVFSASAVTFSLHSSVQAERPEERHEAASGSLCFLYLSLLSDQRVPARLLAGRRRRCCQARRSPPSPPRPPPPPARAFDCRSKATARSHLGRSEAGWSLPKAPSILKPQIFSPLVSVLSWHFFISS